MQAAPQRKRMHAPTAAGNGTKQATNTNTNNTVVVDLSDEYMRSVHTAYPEVFSLNRMDPSLAIGFYCRGKKEFAALEAALKELKAAHHPSSPDLFTFCDKSPDYLSSGVNEMMMLGELDGEDNGVGANDDESDDDEYVML